MCQPLLTDRQSLDAEADGRVCEEEIIKGKRWINVFAPRFTALYCQSVCVCVCELKGERKTRKRKTRG